MKEKEENNMHLKDNEVAEGPFGCIWFKDEAVILLKKGTWAT